MNCPIVRPLEMRARNIPTKDAQAIHQAQKKRVHSDIHSVGWSIKSVIAIGYELNMVESTCLRIDEVWSGLKFTHPKPGKTYANSYGTLPDQRT